MIALNGRASLCGLPSGRCAFLSMLCKASSRPLHMYLPRISTVKSVSWAVLLDAIASFSLLRLQRLMMRGALVLPRIMSVHPRATKVVRVAHQARDRCRFHINKSRTKKELIRMQIAMTRSGEKIIDIGIACVTLFTTRIVMDFLAALLLER